MGITQSDEYCEVYDRFMEEYDEGRPVSDITKEILEEYLDEFEEDDGVLHDVYFALSKAEWMCGGISPAIYNRICHIIKNDQNIVFLRELGAREADLKVRKKNLEKFMNSLGTPRAKAKKRKIPEEKYVPRKKQVFPALPNVKVGDVLAYKCGKGYRIFAIVRREKLYARPAAYAYAWRGAFREIPSLMELKQGYIMPLGYFLGDTFPDEKDYILIGNMADIKKLGTIYRPEVINEVWRPATFALAKPGHLVEEYPMDLCLALGEVYNKIQCLKNKRN